MKKRIWSIVASMIMFSMALPAMAAPLFPDVPDNHWAKDAVAALAAKGLVEGYPDGTFKGDRAATRWETAMIVARLLAKMEQAHATFATKAELDELRKLVNALREELDALGVRVTNLEENVSRLDKRVTELERITFYGEVEARATFQSFSNDGWINNNVGGGGANNTPGPGFLNYDALVGTAAGAGLNPAVAGVWPVADYRNGRALTNGTGFTARALLGVRVRVSDDIDAGAEFSAYSSQGDAVVDAYWGVQQPFLSSPWTANNTVLGGGVNGLNNQPFTRMNLDNFWVIHNPSKTKLVIGAFNEDNMDNILYSGQYNPGAFGNRFNDSYGFDLTGMHDISDWGVLHWELMGTRLPDSPLGAFGFGGGFGAGGFNGGYEPWLFGGNLAFEFEGGFVKGNYARVIQENSAGGLGGFGVGNVGGVNMAPGFGAGYTPLQWVNHPGHYLGQAGVTLDNRPIPGSPFSGNIGNQVMNMWGLSAAYAFDIGEGDQIRIDGEFGRTNYRPNQNSGFDVDGNAFRVGVGANLFNGDLDLAAEYVSVDSTYDPYILRYPGMGVMRLPNIHYFTNLWSLHDTEKYPHNREGFRLKGTWHFNERRGAIWAKLGFLDQKESSLYNVRVAPGALGGGIPGGGIMGHTAGFIDPVFSGFAHPSVYGAGSANSFNNNLMPLENPSGHHNQYAVGATYKFDDPRIKLDLGFERNEYVRNSSLAAFQGGSQNQVNLDITTIHGGLGWEVNDKWTVRGGADWVNIQGHYDPAGLYNSYAIATNSTRFDTVDTDQIIPFIGFDYDISENTTWNMDFRYFNSSSNLRNGTTLNPNATGYTQNPFDWNGIQVTTQFSVKF